MEFPGGSQMALRQISHIAGIRYNKYEMALFAPPGIIIFYRIIFMKNLEYGSMHSGLTQCQAAKLLEQDGFNELPSQKERGVLAMLWSVLREPMLLLLVAAGTIYLFMGERQDALMLLSCVFVVIGITFYQERKTEKTLDALRNLSSPRALVIRNGKQRRIAGREVVRGDIVIVREGDRVPADCIVLSSENLHVDESLLTGESVAVHKTEGRGDLDMQRAGGDDTPFIYSGSLVVSGRGVAWVAHVGIATELGRIGKSLEVIEEQDTLLHKETGRIVRLFSIFGLIACLAVMLIYAIGRGDVLQGILAGLTLSMSMLPEEFPVVLLIFLTLGAWRISKKQVLTRRSDAIETLGAATVLCTDKTGTLTMNKMRLRTLWVSGIQIDSDGRGYLSAQGGEFKNLLEVGSLASQQDPFDPIEKELQRVWREREGDTGKAHESWSLIKEYPLSKELVALSHVWKRDDGKHLVAAKGSPEAILELCHLEALEKKRVMAAVHALSKQGLRVLGAASATFSGKTLPGSQHDFTFAFAGLFGFVDPPRASVAQAITEAYGAGMRVIMITGDYPGTAQFIAQEIGLENAQEYITGEQLSRMRPGELRKKIRSINIFARVAPEQKLQIVAALKANGEIVVMTGDGVNDAPALKAADIGIAMGERGTDVAREASDLVLLNDDFSSIVAAVRLGRRIYNNLKKVMGYILAVHVPIAGMAILPLVFNLPVVLLPAHIAFLELIIDPACSTVFESEKESDNIMKIPPRNINDSIFSKKTVILGLLQGATVLLVTFMLYLVVSRSGRSEEEARTFAFVSLVISNMLMIVVNLSWHNSMRRIFLSGNKVLFFVLGSASIALGGILSIPFLSTLFHLTPISFLEFVLVLLVSFFGLLWFELFKMFNQKFRLQRESLGR